MTEYDWKKGDKLVVLQENSTKEVTAGMIVTADNDICTENDTVSTFVILPNGMRSGSWCNSRFAKIVKGEKIEPKKPVELHLVLVDNCRNFVGVKETYDDAITLAKASSGEVTIYKLTEVAKVGTIREVKKVKVEESKVKSLKKK